MLKGLDPEEARLIIGVTSLFYKGVLAIGSGGGIPMPVKAIVQKIRRPVNHGTGQYSTCWHKHEPGKNKIMNPTYILYLG